MDVYKLDANFQPSDVIDDFKSFIWSERWHPDSSVTMTFDPNSPSVKLLPEESYVGISKSDKVMEVETVEETEETVTITGRSLESWWERRVSDTPYGPLGESDELWDNWNPGDIVVQSLLQFKYDAADNETLPITSLTHSVVHANVDAEYMPPGPVSDWLNTFCDAYDMGYYLVPNAPGTPYLKFKVSTGTNRTSDGSGTPVIFAKALDNLMNTKKLRSSGNYKNIAYVSGAKATLIVGRKGQTTNIAGRARRVLAVDASDIKTAPGTTLNKKLKSRGERELADYKRTRAFDGEASYSSQYVYRTHYFLGDIVELWDEDGVRTDSRVIEHIWSVDDSGERAYPTIEHLE